MQHGAYQSASHECKVARVLAEKGHEVHLVVEQEVPWDTPVPPSLRVTVAPVNDYTKAEEIAKHLAKDSHDVGFASSVSGAPILKHWKVLTGKKACTQVLDVPMWRLVSGAAGPWLAQWRPWFDAMIKMDALIPNTQKTQKDFAVAAGLYGVVPDEVMPPSTVVYYGVDTEAADAAKPGTRLESGHQLACTVSRLVPYKGVDLAMFGIARLPVEKRPLLLVVGDGEDMARLYKLALRANVSTQFTGAVSDQGKFQCIRASDWGLGLQWLQHIPLQFPMESVACGKPCLVARTEVNLERFLDHGVSYVDPMDTEAVAEAILGMQAGKTRVSPEDTAWVHANRSFHSHAEGVLRVLEGLA